MRESAAELKSQMFRWLRADTSVLPHRLCFFLTLPSASKL